MKVINSKRRIILIIDNLTRGGAQRQAFFLAKGLGERGHKVLVLALNDDADSHNVASMASVAEVEVIGKLRLGLGLGPIGLWLRLRAWRPDVILTMLEFSDLLGRIAAHLYGRGSVVTSIRGRNLHKRAWWLWLDRWTMGWADRVVFNSNAIVRGGQEREGVRPEQVCVITNGIEVSDVNTKPVDRKTIGIRAGARILLTVGRLSPEKRFDTLLEAIALLPADVDLLVAGTGPLRSALGEQASGLGLAERIHFLGLRGDVPALLALAEVFVLPSAWEGMPNVVMEGMAAGCPVVATRIDGNVELLPDSSYGWLVEPGQPAQLAAALAEALGDRSEAQQRARRAKARALAEYSVDQMVRRYEALFDQLAVAT